MKSGPVRVVFICTRQSNIMFRTKKTWTWLDLSNKKTHYQVTDMPELLRLYVYVMETVKRHL